MPPVKTRALLLQATVYRESSLILRLYCEQLGMIDGIAKGVRRQGKDHVVLERGQIIEALVYGKPGRSLHTLGSVAVAGVFGRVRSDLLLSAMRDAAFELVLRSIRHEDPNAELYEYLCAYVESLEQPSNTTAFPFALWRFCLDFARHLGFGPDLGTCAICSRALEGAAPAWFASQHGGIACTTCARTSRRDPIPAPALAWLRQPDTSAPTALSAVQQRATTCALMGYCQHHFELHGEFRALDFVCEMIDSEHSA